MLNLQASAPSSGPHHLPGNTCDGASTATGNHGYTHVSAHHDGYTMCLFIIIVHMLQPTPAPGLITDPQQCT